MNRKAVQENENPGGAHVHIPVPIDATDAFRHDATADILHLLVDNPDTSFSNRQLHRLTGKGMGNVNGAVRALEGLGIVQVDRTGRANQVRIDTSRLSTPDSPVTRIPQSAFHAPIRELIERITERIGDDAGIVVFGSVARGTADRSSDIDVLLVVEEGRMDAQREAHRIEDDLASQRFEGDRYASHIIVETRESAPDHQHITQILRDGITVRETPTLDAVKREVFEDGA